MSLWSISFSYLDALGLLALWREALLARAVLEGRTKGYKNHPQLQRSKELSDPLEGINTYLYYVLSEGRRRGYLFDGSKVDSEKVNPKLRIAVKEGQLSYEFDLLKCKLKVRARKQYELLQGISIPEPCPMFYAVKGGTEPWERVKPLRC